MNNNHLHCRARDIQNNNIKSTIKDATNKKSKVLCFKDNYIIDQNYCHDLGTSSSTLVTDVHTDLPRKQRNLHSSGSVDKRPLARSRVKSSTCFEYGFTDDSKSTLIQTSDPRIQNNRKTSRARYHNTEDDIDYIPVKLASSDTNFNTANDKMKSSRNSTNAAAKVVDKKVNSWGKILKDQNVKDKKKPLGSTLPPNKTKTVISKQSQSLVKEQLKDKHVFYESALISSRPQSNRIKETHNSASSNCSSKPASSKKRNRSKSRSGIENEVAYSDSGTTITGESIMLVDRSAQCSSTNIEMDKKWQRAIDINQAGDNGLAYFNPVRTLNFLVRELRGKLSEGSEDENMARIIHDMENTIARLSSTSSSSNNMMENNWNTLISEDDLKYVLDLLQSPPSQKPPPVVPDVIVPDKCALELQIKLEETCTKLETMCVQMEQVTCIKLREEKDALFNQLNERNKAYEALTNKITQHEHFIKDLKKKTDEQAKIINALKETNNRASALNKILNEQLEDTEKKYQELVTEMQFLMLEKEKNIVLMKCKDQDLVEMRKNLEEIKTLVIEHLTSINLPTNDSGTKLSKENKMDFDNLTTVSALSMTMSPYKKIEGEVPKGSNDTMRIASDNDSTWSKLNNQVATTVSQNQLPAELNPSKTACIKVSIKNLLEEMKQTQLNKNLSVQNLINLDDPTGISNWSDLDISDDELQSAGGFRISDTDTNF